MRVRVSSVGEVVKVSSFRSMLVSLRWRRELADDVRLAIKVEAVTPSVLLLASLMIVGRSISKLSQHCVESSNIRR